MDSLKASELVAQTMEKARMPLSGEQRMLLAGSMVVCMEASASAERDRLAHAMADCVEKLARRFPAHGELTAELWKSVATLRA